MEKGLALTAGLGREGATALWQLCACLCPLLLAHSTPAMGHVFPWHRPLTLCPLERQMDTLSPFPLCALLSHLDVYVSSLLPRWAGDLG